METSTISSPKRPRSACSSNSRLNARSEPRDVDVLGLVFRRA